MQFLKNKNKGKKSITRFRCYPMSEDIANHTYGVKDTLTKKILKKFFMSKVLTQN